MPSDPSLQDVIDKLMDVFYRTDIDGKLEMVSPSVERYGYRVRQMIGRNVGELYVDPSARDRLLGTLKERGSLQDYEVELKRADGEPVPVSVSARLLVDAAGRPTGVEGLLRDITVRKRNEAALRHEIADRRKAEAQLRESRAQLRALSRRLLSVAEDERGRIAREIHDELGQMLSALTLDLGWLGNKLAAESSPLVDKVKRMSQLVDVMIESVQTIATNLRPAMLDTSAPPPRCSGWCASSASAPASTSASISTTRSWSSTRSGPLRSFGWCRRRSPTCHATPRPRASRSPSSAATIGCGWR